MGKSGRIRSRHRAAAYLLRTSHPAPSSSSQISAMSASTMSSSPAMEGHGVSGETSSTSQTTIVEEVIGALVGKQRLEHKRKYYYNRIYINRLSKNKYGCTNAYLLTELGKTRHRKSSSIFIQRRIRCSPIDGLCNTPLTFLGALIFFARPPVVHRFYDIRAERRSLKMNIFRCCARRCLVWEV